MRKVIGWDEYFMKLMDLTKERSKDPNTNIGAVLVDNEHDIITTGYNGMPQGMPENDEIWQRPIKYDFVLHAESNAVLRAARKGRSTLGATLYTTGMPCNNCARNVIAAGVKKIVFFDDGGWAHERKEHITRKLLDLTNTHYVVLNPDFTVKYDSRTPWRGIMPEHMEDPE